MLRQRLDESDPVLVKRVDDYYDGRIGMPRLGSEYDYSAAFELVIPDESARKRYLEQLFEGARAGFGHRGGARAVEHLRLICSELQIAHVRQQLSFSMFTDFENFSEFRPGPQHEAAATVLFDQLESWTGALKRIRVDVPVAA